MLVLLDWEKAFDKVDRNKLHEALESIGVNITNRNIVKALNKKQSSKHKLME